MIQYLELRSTITEVIVKCSGGQYGIILYLVLILMLIMSRFIIAKLLGDDFTSLMTLYEVK